MLSLLSEFSLIIPRESFAVGHDDQSGDIGDFDSMLAAYKVIQPTIDEERIRVFYENYKSPKDIGLLSFDLLVDDSELIKAWSLELKDEGDNITRPPLGAFAVYRVQAFAERDHTKMQGATVEVFVDLEKGVFAEHILWKLGIFNAARLAESSSLSADLTVGEEALRAVMPAGDSPFAVAARSVTGFSGETQSLDGRFSSPSTRALAPSTDNDRNISSKLDSPERAILGLIIEGRLLGRDDVAMLIAGRSVDLKLERDTILIKDASGALLTTYVITDADRQAAKAMTSANAEENQAVMTTLRQNNAAFAALRYAESARAPESALVGAVIRVPAGFDAMNGDEQALNLSLLVTALSRFGDIAARNGAYFRIFGASKALEARLKANAQVARLIRMNAVSFERLKDASGQLAQETVLTGTDRLADLADEMDLKSPPAYLPAQFFKAGEYANFDAIIPIVLAAVIGENQATDSLVRAYAAQLPANAVTDPGDLKVSIQAFLDGKIDQQTLERAVHYSLRALTQILKDALSLQRRVRSIQSAA